MPNMSYCRFENTYNDLDECYRVLSDAMSVGELEKETNIYDRKFIRRLIDLCSTIHAEFGEHEDDDEDE